MINRSLQLPSDPRSPSKAAQRLLRSRHAKLGRDGYSGLSQSETRLVLLGRFLRGGGVGETENVVAMTAGEAHATMRSLPVAGLDVILGGRVPLVLAPHPDDESLGCGGLLAASVAAGLEPSVLVVTDGSASHPGSAQFPPARLAAVRQEEAIAAVAALGLGAERIGFLGVPDSRAPHDGPKFEAAVAEVAAAAAARGTGVLLAPWRHDPHRDHVAVHRIAAEVARRSGLGHLAYPVWGMTLPKEASLQGPEPCGWRLDVRQWLPAKRMAVQAHRTQMGEVVRDNPGRFTLPQALLEAMLGPYEVFLNQP